MSNLLDDLYQEAKASECPDCGGDCEVCQHPPWVSIVCEKCRFEVACYDGDPREEAAIYY